MSKSLPAPAPPSAHSTAVHRRAEELDALEAILPLDRREQLAKLLTDDDVATLKHLAGEGMGDKPRPTSRPGLFFVASINGAISIAGR